MSEKGTDSRGGFALAATIFALVVLGILATGGFYLARQETRIGVASKRATTAFYLAEQGMNQVMSEWDMSAYSSLPYWGTKTVSENTGNGTWTVNVTRMTDNLFFLGAMAGSNQGTAVYGNTGRMLGVVARLSTADLQPEAALTTRGQTTIRGTAEVHGEDQVPPGWAAYCDPPSGRLPGILTNLESEVSYSGVGHVTGDPPVAEANPPLTDEYFTEFGDFSWEDLVALADISLPGGNINTTQPDSTADGVCLTGQGYPLNWGNPLNPPGACGDWFPMIHIRGSGSIQSGGVGQGILLVDGDLNLRGNFIFHGIIIVQGNFETEGAGNRVFGGVMASNAQFDLQKLIGGSVVEYSECASTRAVTLNKALTKVRPIERRSWVDLSSVIGG
jgi:hypothetical protein